MSAIATAPAPPARPTARAQAFLFCDIVGWTAMTAEQGDERGADLAIGFRRCAAGLLPVYGAEEVKALGDGVMLRCADPDAAVRLGVHLVACSDVPVRVGIHFGPAVSRDGDWYGTTVNVAARLCAAAHAGQVLVSAATRWAAGTLDGLRCDGARVYRLRNLREPVAAHVVLSPDPDRRRPRRPAPALAGPASPASGAAAAR